MAATATLAEAVTRFAKRSAKRLGSGAVSKMLKPATRNGPGATPTRNRLARARQQIALEAGGAAQAVDCSACRAGWGRGVSLRCIEAIGLNEQFSGVNEQVQRRGQCD